MDQIRAKRIHFSANDDLYLLREVVGQNPYENEQRWNLVSLNVMQITGKNIQTRTLKERVQLLVTKFLEKDSGHQYKSGIKEEVTEIDDLLRAIADLMVEFKKKIKITPKASSQTPSKIANQTTPYQKGILARENATKALMSNSKNLIESPHFFVNEVQIPLHNVDDGISFEEQAVINSPENFEFPENPLENNIQPQAKENPQPGGSKLIESTPKASGPRKILVPTRKRLGQGTSLKQTTLNYLNTKNERWFTIRSKELKLQERDTNIQKKRLKVEEEKRKKKLEMEEQKWKIEIEILKNQQKLMEIAFRANNNIL